jgi:hypothetical protein
MEPGEPNLRIHIIGILAVAVGCLIGGAVSLAIGGSVLDGGALLVAGLGGSYAAYHGRHYMRQPRDRSTT